MYVERTKYLLLVDILAAVFPLHEPLPRFNFRTSDGCSSHQYTSRMDPPQQHSESRLNCNSCNCLACYNHAPLASNSHLISLIKLQNLISTARALDLLSNSPLQLDPSTDMPSQQVLERVVSQQLHAQQQHSLWSQLKGSNCTDDKLCQLNLQDLRTVFATKFPSLDILDATLLTQALYSAYQSQTAAAAALSAAGRGKPTTLPAAAAAPAAGEPKVNQQTTSIVRASQNAFGSNTLSVAPAKRSIVPYASPSAAAQPPGPQGIVQPTHANSKAAVNVQPATALALDHAIEQQKLKTIWVSVSRMLKELVAAAQLDKNRHINQQDHKKLEFIQQRLVQQFGEDIPFLKQQAGQAIIKEKIRHLMNNKRSLEAREEKQKQLRAKIGDQQYKRLTPYQFAEGMFHT